MKQGKLPILSGIEVVKVLGKIGYVVNDQKGSHIHLRHLSRRPVTVPNHPVIARGTLRMIMNQVEILLEDFWKLCNLKDISNFGHKMDAVSIVENNRADRPLPDPTP